MPSTFVPIQASSHKSRFAPAPYDESEGGDLLPTLAFVSPQYVPIYDTSGQLVKTLAAGETPEWQCLACMKGFASKQSLDRHKDRHPLCKDWKETNAQPVLLESVYKWATETLETALRDAKKDAILCKFCKKEFANIGNLHKHFASATVCNRLAYCSVSETFTSAFARVGEAQLSLS